MEDTAFAISHAALNAAANAMIGWRRCRFAESVSFERGEGRNGDDGGSTLLESAKTCFGLRR